ncbi:hypothetical protein F5B22DRAFT_176522 [Xylaria bambusicola]|uniref:uncharacterized protein n=1 Tax=Xylaria bambusicola TaxID=326684 RepID=UPI002007A604|nr:uncharacterized protein F5B22DRAFT_176522 [Xylaria bambusicola]KAI0516710.1 hypothetical protein F5B22DRAFT_176522 [Xylaria bambusicola]
MSRFTQDGVDQLLEPVVEYGCSPWRASSQRASDLYESGVRLWRKEDLVNIEQQLAQSRTAEKFTVRRLDGSLLHIKNPMFGVQNPIWKPYVEFQEYWRLVWAKPNIPPELYTCTYLVDWDNLTLRNYEGPIENVHLLFESSRQKWNASATCEALTSQLLDLLIGDGNSKKVTKVVCFGLGDLNFKPPDRWRIENNSQTEDKRQPETNIIEGALIHHAIALTIAEVTRSCIPAERSSVRLLTQDPKYSDETKALLRKIGFEITGEYGAGGFAEVDDESIVFSAFAAAPVKQMVADLALPVAIICAKKTSAGVYNHLRNLWADPESPRTKQMWKEYETWKFPTPTVDIKLDGSLHQLEISARIGERLS